MAGQRPSWEQALNLLQRQEHELAKSVLAKANGKARNVDEPGAWVTSLLYQMINNRPANRAPDKSVTTTPTTPAAQEALSVGQALQIIIDARVALSSGHTDELVRLATLSAEDTKTEWPWITMQIAGVLQAAFRFSGKPALFDHAVNVCSTLVDRLDAPNIAIQARALLGSMYLLTGQFHRTLSHCDAAIQLADVSDLFKNPSVAMAHQFRGYVLFEWHRLDEAKTALQHAWDVTNEQHAGVRSGVARVMAALTSVLDEQELSDTWMERLEEIVTEPMTLRNGEWLAAVRARHGLANGRDLRTLEAWRRTYDYYREPLAKLTGTAVRARLHEYDHLLIMLEHTGQWPELFDIATMVLGSIDTMRNWFRVRALTAQAVALDGTGKQQEAVGAFSEALVLGEQGSFVRAFIDGAPRRIRLLRWARQRVDVGKYAERILQAVPEIADESPTPPLTSRQIEVLAEVARGLSNVDIAHRLRISLPTVKSHLQGVFARLNVKSRTAAVIEATRQGLIES